MNFGSEVFWCASRPMEATAWINDVELAKSIVELQTSKTITEAEMQTNF